MILCSFLFFKEKECGEKPKEKQCVEKYKDEKEQTKAEGGKVEAEEVTLV